MAPNSAGRTHPKRQWDVMTGSFYTDFFSLESQWSHQPMQEVNVSIACQNGQ